MLAIFGFSQTALSLACLSVKPLCKKRPASLSSVSELVRTEPPPWVFIAVKPIPSSLQAATASVASDCPLVDAAIRLGREGEAFAWWAILKATQAIEQRGLRWIAWLWFLLSGSLSLWAYSSFCVQLVHYAQGRMQAS